tara:strand:+ start:670 stop:1062 length:393 start_codon:yes stop_codon:yes gene_type:complete
MKSWKKENKIMMSVFYNAQDNEDGKYKECNIEGQRVYLNFPDAVEFITILEKDGKVTSIANKLIDRIVYKNIPKDYLLTEQMTMDSAKLRMKMLGLDLKDQKERIEQQESLEELQKNKETNTAKDDMGSV